MKMINEIEAIKNRHSVRAYKDVKIETEILNKIQSEIDLINKHTGLHIQLITDNKDAFDCFWGHYGNFKNVSNFIALAGKSDDGLDEKLGYYGEKLAILIQTLGLNSCFVGLSYSKKKARVQLDKDEKLRLVLAFGYGETQGNQHKSKDVSKIVKIEKGVGVPKWFEKGVEFAMLAPTALNQQKFEILFDGKNVQIKAKRGPYSKVDLGIVKYNFEVGAGKENFDFENK